jgi:hypothetical protein
MPILIVMLPDKRHSTVRGKYYRNDYLEFEARKRQSLCLFCARAIPGKVCAVFPSGIA